MKLKVINRKLRRADRRRFQCLMACVQGKDCKLALGDFNFCFCLSLAPLNSRCVANSVQFNSCVGIRKLGRWNSPSLLYWWVADFNLFRRKVYIADFTEPIEYVWSHWSAHLHLIWYFWKRWIYCPCK